jgi:2-dehydro-3-deoxyphosphogluconate aldolase/(4S)-4-hydroxy-2-oxoglutarate aldolase
MNTVLETLSETGLVPVVTIEDPYKAVPLARALAAGGLPCVEVAFRTAEASESIRRIAAEVPGITVGAGTVLSIALAEKALDAGAQFVVTPGFNPIVVDWCLNAGLTIVPGVNNPTGVESAMEKGLSRLKFFPAEVSGGTGMLKALSGPYPMISFMPTGGIGQHNLDAYLKLNNVFAVGGSWMVTRELIDREDWTGITALAEEAVANVQALRRKN